MNTSVLPDLSIPFSPAMPAACPPQKKRKSTSSACSPKKKRKSTSSADELPSSADELPSSGRTRQAPVRFSDEPLTKQPPSNKRCRLTSPAPTTSATHPSKSNEARFGKAQPVKRGAVLKPEMVFHSTTTTTGPSKPAKRIKKTPPPPHDQIVSFLPAPRPSSTSLSPDVTNIDGSVSPTQATDGSGSTPSAESDSSDPNADHGKEWLPSAVGLPATFDYILVTIWTWYTIFRIYFQVHDIYDMFSTRISPNTLVHIVVRV
jgi:hypothetical protein